MGHRAILKLYTNGLKHQCELPSLYAPSMSSIGEHSVKREVDEQDIIMTNDDSLDKCSALRSHSQLFNKKQTTMEIWQARRTSPEDENGCSRVQRSADTLDTLDS